MTAIDDLCQSWLDLKWHFDPAAGSAAGDTASDSRLGHYDAESMRTHLAAFRALAGAVEQLDTDELSEEIDRTALLDEIRSTITRLSAERPAVRNPEFWLSHLFQGFYALLSRPGGSLAERAPAALDRLREVPAFLASARATIEEPPAVFVDTALGMLGGGGTLLAQLAGALASAAPAMAEDVNAATREALEELASFGRALRDEIEPDPEPRAFAIGEDQFDHRLHQEHALRAGAPEFWRYGLHLQGEVEAALVALARTIDPTRSWRDIAEAAQSDTPAESDVLSVYRSEVERARALVVEQDLAALPQAPLEVVPTPEFLAPLVPFAAYEPPPVLLPGSPGRFFVTAAGPSDELPSTVVHEAWPGHHLQLGTAQQLPSLVRRHIWTPLTVEGWALYSEQLMDDAGFFRTPVARLFHLVNLLWRAVRILVDVGLHTRDMTPADAVQYMVDRLPMDRKQAEAEVRRYCAMPTYQLCYAVGRRDLLSLREEYRRRVGSDFSLRRFHDEVLSYGGLPVTLIRWGMGLEEG